MNMLRAHAVRGTAILFAAIATPPARADDLTRYSLEDLLTLEATSVAKKRQSVADAAAAVFIITQEDIRRSGARTVPDLLRMVPGVEVGSIDGNSTAVSMRGFNTRFANSVLVLVNGRAIYVAAVSGVLWDQLLEPLDTIERIEVVRGPGATVWGANAVNGIINIITKDAAQTRGGSVTARTGTDGQDASLRLGGGGDATSYRITAAGRRRLASAVLDNGSTARIQTRGAQIGAQFDSAPNYDDAFTFKGIVEAGDFGPFRRDAGNRDLTRGRYAEGNALGRWSHRLSGTADMMVQGFVDRVVRNESGVTVGETLLDLEANGNTTFGSDNIGVGINYRKTSNRLSSGVPVLGFLKDSSRDELVSGFVQNDHWLVPDRLRVTLGTKIEHSSLSGLNLQPSARLLWRAGKASLWASWSRAVRTPSLFERNATFAAQAGPSGESYYSPIPTRITAEGSATLRSARLDAVEAGARFSMGDVLTVDIAAYHNLYRRLIGFAPVTASVSMDGPLPMISTEYRVLDNSKARSNGVEIAASLKASLALRFDGYWAFNDTDFVVGRASSMPTIPGLPSGVNYQLPVFPQPGLTTTPRNLGGIRAHWDIAPNLEADGWLRHVDPLKLVAVPAYTTLDLRFAVQLDRRATLSLIGQNLFDHRRQEFRESLISAAPAVISREVALDLRLRL